MTSYWRSKAAPIIARVLRETQGQPTAVVRRALREAYPFGERSHDPYPYKVWLDEVARQQGRKPPLGTRVRRPEPPAEDPRQARLW